MIVGLSGAAQDALVTAGSFVLDAAEAKLLSEIGFIAAYRGDVVLADAVFDSLARLRPNRAYPWIGKSLARFHKGKADEAAALLERQIPQMAADEIGVLQAWRGMALQLSGHTSQAQTLLEQVAAVPGPGRDLARSLLGLSEGN